MKKIVSIFLAALMLLSSVALFAACGGQPVDTSDGVVTDDPNTDAPETDAPETDAPETDAPVTDEILDEPGDPVLDPVFAPDVEAPSTVGDVVGMIFDVDFDNVDTPSAQIPDGFGLNTTGWDFVAGEDGYLKNNGINGQILVTDKKVALAGKSFIFEAEMTFDKLPTKEEDVTNFPLSLLTWVRKDANGDNYDWAMKLDNEGTIYVANTSTPTAVKIESGKKYTFAAFYDTTNNQLQIFVDGEVVGVKSFQGKELTGSMLRLFDTGTGKAHFSATLHSMKAYYCDATQLLNDAERDVFTAMASYLEPSLYFAGYTDKNALSYEVGEEMSFEIYLMCNGEVVSAPYFYYSVQGEDGQAKTEGYADGSKGHFTVKAKMSKPGAVRVIAYVCDENKVKQTKNNSNLYVNLETSTPQTADLCFKGGAIAGLEQINLAGKIPTDLEAYWDGVVEECYDGDIKLLRFQLLEYSDYAYDTSEYDLYIVEIECEGGFSTGYLSVPKNASELELRMSFVSYGNWKKPVPYFDSKAAFFSVCAHSYKVDDPNALAPNLYGFDAVENQNRDTVYFKNMFIRNIMAARFLKAYIGDSSYGKITFNGKTIAPLGKWKSGDVFSVSGGSQASFQSVAITAMDSDITSARIEVPWFCDIGDELVGRFSGWKPDYTEALMYYDSIALGTLIKSDVTVTISAGLGDTTSEPSGVVALYNALNCKKSLSMYQNREHTYLPPVSNVYTVSEK